MAPSLRLRSAATKFLIGSSILLSTAHSFQNVGVRKVATTSSQNKLLSQPTTILHPASLRQNVKTYEIPTTTTTTSLSALPSLFTSVGSPLASVSVLALVILVHEAGHFIAARSLGITVKEFSVGVGPRLAGFRRYPYGRRNNENEEEEDDDGGIDFSLRAIPLGGYVRFPENYNGTLAMEQEDEARALRKERRMEQRILARNEANGISGRMKKSSGGLLSLLTFGILEQQAQEEEEYIRRKQEEMEAEEKRKKGQWWKNVLPVNSKTKDDERKMTISAAKDEGPIKAPPIEYYDDPNLLQNRPWIERAIVLSGGVIFNLLLAFGLYFGEITVGNGLVRPMFEPGAVVSSIPRESAPSAGLLEPGDVIVGINDQKMLLSKTYDTPAAQGALTDLISSIRSTPPGESIHLSVVKGGKGKSETQKSPIVDVAIQPRPSLDKLGNPTGPQSIGAMLAPNYVGSDLVRASNLGDAVVKSGNAVKDLTAETTKSLLGFFGNILAGKGMPAGQSMSGPIGVIRTGADIVSSSDLSAVIMFAAAISINLAVVNSLPLPALDGGQLAFVLAEAVAGRKIDQRVQEQINAAALFMLLFISFSTALGDVGSLVGL